MSQSRFNPAGVQAPLASSDTQPTLRADNQSFNPAGVQVPLARYGQPRARRALWGFQSCRGAGASCEIQAEELAQLFHEFQSCRGAGASCENGTPMYRIKKGKFQSCRGAGASCEEQDVQTVSGGPNGFQSCRGAGASCEFRGINSNDTHR